MSKRILCLSFKVYTWCVVLCSILEMVPWSQKNGRSAVLEHSLLLSFVKLLLFHYEDLWDFSLHMPNAGELSGFAYLLCLSFWVHLYLFVSLAKHHFMLLRYPEPFDWLLKLICCVVEYVDFCWGYVFQEFCALFQHPVGAFCSSRLTFYFF